MIKLKSIHNQMFGYFQNKIGCPLCVLWIIPFFAGVALLWTIALAALLLLALFFPVFLPIFILASIGIAMLNIIFSMPYLVIVFLALVIFLKKDIAEIWQNLFIKKSYSLHQSNASRSTPKILLLFLAHGLVFLLPIPNIAKFLILTSISIYMFKKLHSNNQCNH